MKSQKSKSPKKTEAKGPSTQAKANAYDELSEGLIELAQPLNKLGEAAHEEAKEQALTSVITTLGADHAQSYREKALGSISLSRAYRESAAAIKARLLHHGV